MATRKMTANVGAAIQRGNLLRIVGRMKFPEGCSGGFRAGYEAAKREMRTKIKEAAKRNQAKAGGLGRKKAAK